MANSETVSIFEQSHCLFYPPYTPLSIKGDLGVIVFLGFDEFIRIHKLVPNGSAFCSGELQIGDTIVVSRA